MSEGTGWPCIRDAPPDNYGWTRGDEGSRPQTATSYVRSQVSDVGSTVAYRNSASNNS